MYVISILLSLIFLVLSILHLNWAIGNTWGLKYAVPTKSDSEELFIPGTLPTLIIALGLLGFAFFYFINPEPGNPRNWIFDWGRVIIPSIFLIRAIGDFNYAGFFKKIKDTTFAKMDSKYYSPLCLLIAALGFAVKYL